ncbi:MAG: hypothetical protein KGZ42_07340 [Melioribacter sp.]|nr:hypothetical protein [Melioribacter sp.]
MTLQTELKLYLPIPLTEKQKAELGERMSKVELQINSLESQKKNTVAAFTEEIKELESELYGLAKKFENNTDQVEVDCRVEFNTPERGKKTIMRLDTNTIARIEDMSEYEIKAIEQPDLFDQKNGNYALNIHSHYGIEVDRIFSSEELKNNIFIVNQLSDLSTHGIDPDGIVGADELIGCLALKLSKEQAFESFPEGIGHCFIAEGETEEDPAWHFFKSINPDEETEEDNSDYQIPENENAA